MLIFPFHRRIDKIFSMSQGNVHFLSPSSRQIMEGQVANDDSCRTPMKGQSLDETLKSPVWYYKRQFNHLRRIMDKSDQNKQIEDYNISNQRSCRRGSLFVELQNLGVEESTCDRRQRMYSLLKASLGYCEDLS